MVIEDGWVFNFVHEWKNMLIKIQVLLVSFCSKLLQGLRTIFVPRPLQSSPLDFPPAPPSLCSSPLPLLLLTAHSPSPEGGLLPAAGTVWGQ